MSLKVVPANLATTIRCLADLEKIARPNFFYAIRNNKIVVANSSDADALHYVTILHIICAGFLKAYENTFMGGNLYHSWIRKIDCLTFRLANLALKTSELRESISFASCIEDSAQKDMFRRIAIVAIEKDEFHLVTQHFPYRGLHSALDACAEMIQSDRQWLVYGPLESLAKAHGISSFFNSMEMISQSKKLGELGNWFLIETALAYVKFSPNFRVQKAHALAEAIQPEPRRLEIQRIICWKTRDFQRLTKVLTLSARLTAASTDPKTSPDLN